MAIKNAFYAQSGGVTAVINASAAGVLETARAHPNKNWNSICWEKWNYWSTNGRLN